MDEEGVPDQASNSVEAHLVSQRTRLTRSPKLIRRREINMIHHDVASRTRVGWPRVLPPGAPTDPDVRTLAHPVPLMLDSPCSQTPHARIAILGRDGDTWFQVQSLGRISRPRVQQQAPPYGFSFPQPGPAGPVPRRHQYYEGATTSCRPSRRTSFPSLGGTSVALA